MTRALVCALALCLFPGLIPGLALAASPKTYDLILRGGTIYDGSGGQPFVGDWGVRGDGIVGVGAVGDLGNARGKREVDARGLAVSPGFVNMLSWATESLLIDGRA